MSVWWPRSEAELIAAWERGELRESRWLELKRELPRTGQGERIAKQVAAMANDGGVILYGVDETEGPAPMPLSGAQERIVQIVSSGVHGAPEITVLPLATSFDPAGGYLAVIVLASPRAPHMVELGGINRYYGRKGTVTEELNGDEVDRLLERRAQQSRDRDAWLDAKIRTDRSGLSDEEFVPGGGPQPFQPSVLTVAVAPTLRDDERLRRVRDYRTPSAVLHEILTQTINSWRFLNHGDGERHGPVLEKVSMIGWRPIGSGYLAAYPALPSLDQATPAEIEVSYDCSVRTRVLGLNLVVTEPSGRFVGDRVEPVTRNYLNERQLIQHVVHTYAFAAELLHQSGYLGQVDVGLGITRVHRALSAMLGDRSNWPQPSYPARVGYLDHDYRSTDRVMSQALHHRPDRVTRRQLQPLLEALAQGEYPSGLHPLGVDT